MSAGGDALGDQRVAPLLVFGALDGRHHAGQAPVLVPFGHFVVEQHHRLSPRKHLHLVGPEEQLLHLLVGRDIAADEAELRGCQRLDSLGERAVGGVAVERELPQADGLRGLTQTVGQVGLALVGRGPVGRQGRGGLIGASRIGIAPIALQDVPGLQTVAARVRPLGDEGVVVGARLAVLELPEPEGDPRLEVGRVPGGSGDRPVEKRPRLLVVAAVELGRRQIAQGPVREVGQSARRCAAIRTSGRWPSCSSRRARRRGDIIAPREPGLWATARSASCWAFSHSRLSS